jgi:hypothetical protein
MRAQPLNLVPERKKPPPAAIAGDINAVPTGYDHRYPVERFTRKSLISYPDTH